MLMGIIFGVVLGVLTLAAFRATYLKGYRDAERIYLAATSTIMEHVNNSLKTALAGNSEDVTEMPDTSDKKNWN